MSKISEHDKDWNWKHAPRNWRDIVKPADPKGFKSFRSRSTDPVDIKNGPNAATQAKRKSRITLAPVKFGK